MPPDSAPIAPDEVSPQDQRRQHVLDAARNCFATHGFHGASMQQICAEARMSPGALYRYFPSKDAIIEAIAETERGRAAKVMGRFMVPGPIVDRIVAAGIDYLTMVRERGMHQLTVEICAESMRNAAIGELFRCMEHDVRREIHDAILAAVDAGEVDPTVDVAMTVHFLLATGDGLAMRMGLENGDDIARIEPLLRRTVIGLLRPPAKAAAADGH